MYRSASGRRANRDRPPTPSEQAALARVWKAVSEAQANIAALVKELGQIWVCPKCGEQFAHETANSMSREHAACDAWLERAAPDPQPREGRAFGPRISPELDSTAKPGEADDLHRDRSYRFPRPDDRDHQDATLIDDAGISQPPGGRLDGRKLTSKREQRGPRIDGARLPARKTKKGAMVDWRRVD